MFNRNVTTPNVDALRTKFFSLVDAITTMKQTHDDSNFDDISNQFKALHKYVTSININDLPEDVAKSFITLEHQVSSAENSFLFVFSPFHLEHLNKQKQDKQKEQESPTITISFR